MTMEGAHEIAAAMCRFFSSRGQSVSRSILPAAFALPAGPPCPVGQHCWPARWPHCWPQVALH